MKEVGCRGGTRFERFRGQYQRLKWRRSCVARAGAANTIDARVRQARRGSVEIASRGIVVGRSDSWRWRRAESRVHSIEELHCARSSWGSAAFMSMVCTSRATHTLCQTLSAVGRRDRYPACSARSARLAGRIANTPTSGLCRARKGRHESLMSAFDRRRPVSLLPDSSMRRPSKFMACGRQARQLAVRLPNMLLPRCESSVASIEIWAPRSARRGVYRKAEVWLRGRRRGCRGS